MPKPQKPKPVEFTVRMSPELRLIIDDRRGDKSVNQIINEWLWSKATGDDADRIADVLRGLLASMNEGEREAYVANTISNLEVLTKWGKRSRRT